MECNEQHPDLGALGMRPGPNLKDVERFINVDISQPIDLSQCQIHEVSAMPMFSENDHFRYFERKALLHTFVINEGEREELLIEFTLKSKHYPDKKPDEKEG